MTEKKRNTVVINESQQWMFDGFPRLDMPTILMKVSGTCNDRAFEGLYTYEPGINSKLDMFSEYGVTFDKDEYHSIARKIKALVSEQFEDRRGETVPEGHRSVYGYEWDRQYRALHEAYMGTRVDLNVSFADKEAVKAMGANWDNTGKCWFIYSRNPHYVSGEMDQWLAQNTENAS